MKSKEWRETLQQGLWLLLFLAGMHLLMFLAGLAGPDTPLTGEKSIALCAVSLVMYLTLSGIGAFAAERGQGAMEYALALPVARRRLLWGKFLPRLAAALLSISLLWALVAWRSELPEFPSLLFISLLLLHLFLVSFSLSTTSKNFVALFITSWFWFIVTALAASFTAAVTFQLKPGRVYSMPLGDVLRWTSDPFRTESWLSRGGLATIAPLLALLLAMPLALFIAFPRFDDRPRSGFNRRLSLCAVPLLLLGLLLGGLLSHALWITPDFYRHFWLTAGRQLVEFKFPRVTVRGPGSPWSVRTPLDLIPLHEENGWLYAFGYSRAWDGRNGVAYVRLDPAQRRMETLYSTGWENLYHAFFPLGIGAGKIWLTTKVAVGGTLRVGERVRNGRLAIVEVDLETKRATRTEFSDPQLDGLYMPRVVSAGDIAGARFWLVQSAGTLLRLHRDGRVETLLPGIRQGGALFGGDRYLAAAKGSLQLFRITPAGAELEREFPGSFRGPWRMPFGSRSARGPLFIRKVPNTVVSFDPETGAFTELGRGDRLQLEYSGDSGAYFSERTITGMEESGLHVWQKVTLLKLESGRLVKIGEFPACDYFRVTPGGLIVSSRGRVAGYELPTLKEMPFPASRE